MISGLTIWGAALGLYAAFRLWYDNWRAPLTPAEVEAILARLKANYPEAMAGGEGDALRAFLLADDGREFVMLNVVKLSRGEVSHPETGQAMPAAAALQGYTRKFIASLLRRGGHPALVARKVGGYVDSWNAHPDPGWSFIGYMRYRSRRDLAALITDPALPAFHAFKRAAIESTFNFPTQPTLMAFISPRIWIGLILALLAALAHLYALSAS